MEHSASKFDNSAQYILHALHSFCRFAAIAACKTLSSFYEKLLMHKPSSEPVTFKKFLLIGLAASYSQNHWNHILILQKFRAFLYVLWLLHITSARRTLHDLHLLLLIWQIWMEFYSKANKTKFLVLIHTETSIIKPTQILFLILQAISLFSVTKFFQCFQFFCLAALSLVIMCIH